MKEKFLKVKSAFGKLNAKRDENSEKYKMTNLLLTVLFPIFICLYGRNKSGKIPVQIYFILPLQDRQLFYLTY